MSTGLERHPVVSRMVGHRLAIIAALALAALPAATGRALAQSPPPDEDWRTLRTEHFRVTFPPRLAPMARRAAAVAERTHEVLRRELARPPSPVIDLVVTDHADYSNGLARPFPAPRVVLFARPAAAGEFFARSWMELVVVHELVHIFHLEQPTGLGRAVRTVLGRVPMVWPLNPVIGTPTWSTEGLATYYETRLTGAGRVRSSIHDMVIRTAALADALPSLDGTGSPSPVWPAGNRAYIYGGHFMGYVADRYSEVAHQAIIEATRQSIWPTFLHFDHVAARAVGQPFDHLYDDWRQAVSDSAAAVARRVRAAGLTPTRPVAGAGPYALAPRVSPDGTRLTFAASDWRSDPVTAVVELGSGDVRRLAERNQFGPILGPASWLPDGSGVVVAQLEFQGPYRLFSDLWRVEPNGRETRLTRGLRLAQPDVGPGGRVAAVQDHRAGMRLVAHDPVAGETEVLAGAGPGEAFDRPRWSPDGRWVAAGWHADGRADLVVVDAATGAVTRVTDDDALDLAPAWSPDGRWLLWWSDRTGVPNIMAIAVRDGRPEGPVRQVTRVVTGVIDPEVSADGETLYLAEYHTDGWRIAAAPFDPGSWDEAPAPVDRQADGVLPAPAPVDVQADGRQADGAVSAPSAADRQADGALAGSAGAEDEASPYSPWSTLGPYYWLPSWEQVGSTENQSQLRFIGGSMNGTDVVGRHSWAVALARDIDTGRLQGSAFWLYRGLGTPDLYAAADRQWSAGPVATLAGGVTEPLVLLDEELELGASFRWPGWRRALALRVISELRRQTVEGRTLTDDELAGGGVRLRDPRTLAGVAVSPGFGTARVHPFSISPEDGVRLGLTAGRWWDVSGGGRAYDEIRGSAAGFLPVPLWGFANHVLAVRGAGIVRQGPLAPLRAIGGTGTGPLLLLGSTGSFPVRGFDSGDRFGTRGWTANAEWRFPIHMPDTPGAVLGFSLVAVSGALFADAGNAWCSDADRQRPGLDSCFTADSPPLASAGGELKIDLGAFHSFRVRLAMGVARQLQGGAGTVFYLGTAF